MVPALSRRFLLKLFRLSLPLPIFLVALFGSPFGAQAAVDVKGIDVSHWQGTINWTSVKNAGYSFAFMKATQGNTYNDPTFATNLTGATSKGIYVGPYHFCDLNTDTTNSQDPVNEANHFLAIIKPYYQTGMYLPPVADVEGFPSFGSTAEAKAFTSAWVQTFSDTIYDSIGMRPIIYTSKSKATSYYTNAVAATHELWLAWWKGTGVTSPPVASDTSAWGIWQFWQWSDGADSVAQSQPVSGISGNVDRDVFFGTLDQLRNLRFGKDATAKPGDFNRDGIVNNADYNKWLADNGKTVPIYTGADANGDARVTSTDLAVWTANVPEPSSWILLLVGLSMVAIGTSRVRSTNGRTVFELA
jgi:GH25 family lysozyme M1 (1,4-beta-N-acetylmuramidase)